MRITINFSIITSIIFEPNIWKQSILEFVQFSNNILSCKSNEYHVAYSKILFQTKEYLDEALNNI